MADGSRHPCCRAMQQSMESITQTVVYNEIKYKLFAKEFITIEDLEEYDKLTNIQAVGKITIKVMRTISGCEEFLKILQEMPQRQYKELAELITKKCEENATEDGLHTPQQTAVALQAWLCSEDPFQVIPENEVDEILKDGKTLMDTLLETNHSMQPIVESMRLKRSAGKGFTEFLMYIIKVFQKAIQNKTISLKNSVKESTLSALDDHLLVLVHLRKDFCGTEEKCLDDSINLVVTRAMRVKDIIKSLQNKHWIRWFRSAKNISALVPIFERITQVVEGIQQIDFRPYSELLGDVASLKTSLYEIHRRVLTLEAAGFSISVFVAIGGVICLIVGGILLFTPGSPVGVPLAIAGAAAVGSACVMGGGTKVCSSLAYKRLDHSQAKGAGRGDRFIKKSDPSFELSQQC